MVITADIKTTVFVMFCVFLVDVFLFGLVYFWNETLNSVTIVQIIVAIGLSVDYSAHIAHHYLIEKAPSDLKSN